jgi:hypothetical protein
MNNFITFSNILLRINLKIKKFLIILPEKYYSYLINIYVNKINFFFFNINLLEFLIFTLFFKKFLNKL